MTHTLASAAKRGGAARSLRALGSMAMSRTLPALTGSEAITASSEAESGA